MNLLLLPIFNDEGIYLDWGQRMLASPVYAFYSLYDGKQPLLMWLFALVNKFISDPLLAGRLVSVIMGSLSLWGIYKLSKSFWSSLIYLICPLFIFFDRQALMESAIACVGVWLLYFLINFTKTKKRFWAAAFGFLAGLGMFIKSSVLIFFLLGVIYLIYLLLLKIFLKKEISLKENSLIIQGLLIVIFTSFLVLIPLFLQPLAKNIILMGGRYNLTFSELLSFPLNKWWLNLNALLEISLWHLSPPLIFLAVIGILKTLKEKNKKQKIFLFWFLGGLLIAIFTVRNFNPRYLLPFLIPISFFSAGGLSYLFKFKKSLGYLNLLSLVIPATLSFLLIFQPLTYFNYLDYLTPSFSQKHEYVTGNPAGYGLDEVRSYLAEKIKEGPIYIGIRLDAGNPENALMAYYFHQPLAQVIYFDKQLFNPNFPLEKLTLDYPLYFVSRSEHRGGMEAYLIEEKRFYKPEGKSFFGVYHFINNYQLNK